MAIKMRTRNSGLRTQNFIAALCICGIIFFAGCEGKNKSAESGKKGKALSQTEVKDTNSPRKLAAEVKQLKEQLEGLMGLNKEARTEALSTLTAVELTGRSGLYDKNNDKKKETLVVYLKPIDDMGDVVKAAGEVNVQLWNLNAEPNEALLKEWKIEPKDLKKNWSGSLLTSYYKCQFDVNSIVTGKEKELTLKVQFTDYLTGKIFKAQKVINKQ